MCKFQSSGPCKWRCCCDDDRPVQQARSHKHAAAIKAWAEGAKIEIYLDGAWRVCSHPGWADCNDYRVKPTPAPLWAVAHDAFFRHPEHLDTSRQTKWKAVSDAVVLAYEQRRFDAP